MIRATKADRALVIHLLATSFNDNKSVNAMVKQDGKRLQRIRHLMGYAFDVCVQNGEVWLSDDQKACALALMPDKQQTGLRQTWLDIKLLFNAIGPFNMRKALARERVIKARHPKTLLYYLWFIGVDRAEQRKGIGSQLLAALIQEAQSQGRTICLETSTEQNLPWYHKQGFTPYYHMDMGYTLYFFKQ